VERYSDETTTGRTAKARLRSKITIAARAESSDGFQWLSAWRHDFCRELDEPKSAHVQQIADVNPAAAARLHGGLGPCSIFMVDLVENTNEMLQPYRRFLPKTIDDDVDLVEITQNPKTLEHLALGMLRHLRELQILRSGVGAIESLMSQNWVRQALGTAGQEYFGAPERHTFDRDELTRLNDKEFTTLVTRFSVAMADALSPEAQARAIEESAGRMFFRDEHVALRILEEPVSHDYIYDRAFSANVTRSLDRAHDYVARFVLARQRQTISRTMRPGIVREEDSQKLLGIQVADIAAGVAANIIERADLEGIDAARYLRNYFHRVFLNRRWL
jgi:hypothetical protein